MPKRNADQNPPETQLNARGLSLKAHYRHEFPKLVKALEAKGEGTSYFLALQQEYEEMEQHLASQNLPPGCHFSEGFPHRVFRTYPPPPGAGWVE